MLGALERNEASWGYTGRPDLAPFQQIVLQPQDSPSDYRGEKRKEMHLSAGTRNMTCCGNLFPALAILEDLDLSADWPISESLWEATVVVSVVVTRKHPPAIIRPFADYPCSKA